MSLQKCSRIVHDIQIVVDLFHRPIPPVQMQQCFNHFGWKAVLDDLCGITAHNGVWRYIPHNDTICRDDRTVPDRQDPTVASRLQAAAASEPDI